MQYDLQMLSLPFLLLIIFALSSVQSILGVGLLVFGTPTFMLLGYSFHQTLALVLPASILISFLQVIENKSQNVIFKQQFNRYCLPFVLLGVTLINISGQVFNFKIFVGIVLVLSGIVKFVHPLETKLSKILNRYRKSFLISLGLLHGLTNMGGGFLTLFASTINQGNKVKTRADIAYGYILMGSLQYTILIFYKPELFTIQTIYILLTAFVAYNILGKKLFQIANEKLFRVMMSSLILFYGLILLAV
jgi:uncharacterized membrane protein YfcA